MRRTYLAMIVAAASIAPVAGQGPALSAPEMSGPAPPDRAATLAYANRPIVELRAHVLGRMPADRAAVAVRTLDDLVAGGITSPVSTRVIGGVAVVAVGGESVITILPADLDVLAGGTLERTANAAAARLRVALAEAGEVRTPRRLLRAGLEAGAVTAVLGLLLWLLRRLDHLAARWLADALNRALARTLSGAAARATPVHDVLRRVVSAALTAAGLVLVYLWLAFVLRRFPYTRPWGESLRSLLLERVAMLVAASMDAVPGLVTVALIGVAARYVSKAATLLFHAVEHGRLSLPGVYPETAVPTRRLVMAMIWMSALAVAYPYIPGSESSGFKGISVFLGLVISLGSTGVVQHLMSGLMVTFARAVRVGDYARIGDVEGVVLQLGALATKVRTPHGEEITIPNAVVVSQTTSNYSKGGGGAGALLPVTVTIGYDTPWRQVEALLLTAADRTPGLRRTPPPFVWRVSLEDHYVKYTLLAVPEDPARRAELLDRLHTRILDAFNEHGVQIMSPHYVGDPLGPKVVPPSQWYAAPASPSPAVGRAAADAPLHS